MTNWADELIPQYKKGRKDLRIMKHEAPKEDEYKFNSMIDSVGFSLEWMETGRQPGMFRGIDRNNAYRPKQYEDMDVIPDIADQLEEEREPLYMSQCQKNAFIDIIRALSNRERECFIMHTAEQLSMREIAEKLNLKKRTVQQYIERAREKVKKIA